jgi:hypothetical protein
MSKLWEGALDNSKEGFQVFAWRLLLMDCATKEDQDWTECWTYMDLLMHIGLEIWIKISTSGYVFNLFGGEISWMSKRQSIVALSTTKFEYMAATHAIKEEIWLQRLCSSIGFVQQAVRIDCDSQSEIFLGKNQLIIQRQSILMFNITL